MNKDLVYLRPNVQVEPLVDYWFAWPHLIPPATYARNLTERYLKILKSYLDAPRLHAHAVRNPKMAGGPFIDFEGEHLEEVKVLYESILAERRPLLELSDAIRQLDALLRANARGYSLLTLYDEVPPSLRGFVELVYDRNNHPSFRLLEPLLYHSRYYDRSAQSFMLSVINRDNRPFILSTPRLPDDRSLHLRIPFDSDIINELFRMKTTPQERGAVHDLLRPTGASGTSLDNLFTATCPRSYSRYDGHGLRWRYFGHACILIETANINLLFDPILSYTYETQVSRYTYADLPDTLDYVVITHNHQDHILLETLLQLRHKIKTIVVPRGGTGGLEDPSLKLILRAIGFTKAIVELAELDTITLPDGYIQGLPFMGEHGDLNIQTKLGYYVKLRQHTFVVLADSCNIEPSVYEHAHKITGDADLLFVGMECDGAPFSWIYGPLITVPIERRMDDSRRLNGSNFLQARKIADIFGSKAVYVYAMGQEPWITHISSIRYTDQSRPIVESNLLLRDCNERSISAERLFGEREILLTS